jgi:hypothetical protein
VSSPELDAFAEQARAFCHWATGEDDGHMSVAAAVRSVSLLYAAALDLPRPFTHGMSSELIGVEPPAGALDRVISRAKNLPLQVYWEIFNPITDSPEEPVAGSLVDDLSDIYRDVARGLVLFESGERAEALWQWGFNFRTHWGEHATGALRALHAYLAQEDPDGLSQDA